MSTAENPRKFFRHNLRDIHEMVESSAKYPFATWRNNIWTIHSPIEDVDFVTLPIEDPDNPRIKDAPFVTTEFLMRILEHKISKPNAKAMYFRLIDNGITQASA